MSCSSKPSAPRPARWAVANPPFRPTAEVFALLNALLDSFERRASVRRAVAADTRDASDDDAGNVPGSRVIRYRLEPGGATGYFNQADPAPRQAANEQLQQLERAGWVRLEWLRGEAGHLLSAVTLVPAQAGAMFQWLGREPQAARRARLKEMLLAERFRFGG